MTTTVTAFYAALNTLSVAGVRRRFTYEPNSINTADMPAQWVRLPGSGNGADSGFASACVDTSKERTAELVIAMEAAGQETVIANTTGILTLIDALETALDTWDDALPGQMTYTIEAGQVTTAQTAYWALIATVTTRG